MDARSLLGGRVLWRAAEKSERRSAVWFNRAIRVVGTWTSAAIVDVNERIVEVPFVHARVRGHRVLDVGSVESLLALELASLGYAVTALDVRPYPLAHPNLVSVREDIRKTSFPTGAFDTVIALSTLEHIGLGFYGEPVQPEGDGQAVLEIRRVLAAGGTFLLTVPFGRAVTMPGHRVYDRDRLARLTAGFEVEELVCVRRASATAWHPGAPEEAEGVDSSVTSQAVALCALRRPAA